MKAVTIASLVLAGFAVAAPAATTTGTLQLNQVVVETLTESQTGVITFAVTDPSTGAQSGCKTAWNEGGPDASTWFPCSDTSFTFTFPSSISNIEAFEILVEHDEFIGTTQLNSAAGTSVYTCQIPGAVPGTSEECTTGDNTVTVEPIY